MYIPVAIFPSKAIGFSIRIPIFDKKIDKIWISNKKNVIVDQSWDFPPETSIFDQNVNVQLKLRFFDEFSIFDQNFDFPLMEGQ